MFTESLIKTRTPPLQLRKQHCSNSYTPSSRKTCAIYNMVREKNETPQVLKIAVSGVTELLRIFSPPQQTRYLCHLRSTNTLEWKRLRDSNTCQFHKLDTSDIGQCLSINVVSSTVCVYHIYFLKLLPVSCLVWCMCICKR